MEPTSAFATVAPGVRLHLRRWPGQRRPFLLVHGLSSNARLWDGVAEVLADAGHDVTAVDLRSHGESDAPDDGYDAATAATDLAALGPLSHQSDGDAGVPPADGGPGAIVAGQSWGGNVALRLAAEHPELVAGLALVDGGWLAPSARFTSWAEGAAALRPPEIDGRPSAELRDILRRSHADWSPEAIAATMANLRIDEQDRVWRRLSIDRHMRIVRSMWDDPPDVYFPQVVAPTLFIPAISTDPERAAEQRVRVRAAAAALKDATIREYVGGDHDLHAQWPRELAADLLSLNDRVRS